MKQTFILFWNPAISSFTLPQYLDLMSHFYEAEMNWSVWEHEKAKCGDRFFMIRCGKEGPNGLVMAGYFSSAPYQSEDWSGRGREVYYMNLELEFMGHPDSIALSPEILTKNFPDFDWFGGHSGRLFPDSDAPKLEMLFDVYLEQVIERFNEFIESDDDDDNGLLIYTEDDPPQVLSPKKIPKELYHYKYTSFHDSRLQNYLRKAHGTDCELCGYNYHKVFSGKVRKKLPYIYCGNYQSLNWHDIEKDYHCICKNCCALLDSNEEFYKYLELTHKTRLSPNKS